MHDPRNSTALRQLADLGPDPDPPRWRWGIVRPDPEGRLRLPAEARRALRFRPGHRHHVRGICHRFALVARVDDAGASLVVDSRGRLTLPVWLRRGTDRALVVGSDAAATTVVVAPIAVLDRLGELLAGAPCGPDSAPSPGSRPALPTLPARRGGSTGASPSRGRSPTRTSPRRTRDRVQRRGRGQPAHRGGAPRAHRDRPAEQHRPVHPVERTTPGRWFRNLAVGRSHGLMVALVDYAHASGRTWPGDGRSPAPAASPATARSAPSGGSGPRRPRPAVSGPTTSSSLPSRSPNCTASARGPRSWSRSQRSTTPSRR